LSQPTSARFPYTTLFRSRQARIPQAQLAFLRVAGEIDEQQRGLAPVAGRLRAALQLAQGAAHVVRLRAGQEPRIAFLHATQAGEDRKSTRLNSSHGSISY